MQRLILWAFPVAAGCSSSSGASEPNSEAGASSTKVSCATDPRVSSGLEVLRRLHALDATTRIVVLTGDGSIATALDAVRSGAVHYLTKPAELDEILRAFYNDGAPASHPPESRVPSLDRVEWEHIIQRVLVSCDGNITRAAVLLGLHRRSLQRKLSKRPPQRCASATT